MLVDGTVISPGRIYMQTNNWRGPQGQDRLCCLLLLLQVPSTNLKPWLHERFFARAGDAIFSKFVASPARDENGKCSHL